MWSPTKDVSCSQAPLESHEKSLPWCLKSHPNKRNIQESHHELQRSPNPHGNHHEIPTKIPMSSNKLPWNHHVMVNPHGNLPRFWTLVWPGTRVRCVWGASLVTGRTGRPVAPAVEPRGCETHSETMPAPNRDWDCPWSVVLGGLNTMVFGAFGMV